jgi:predicted acylesterase/phospholipase RssA
MKKRILILMMFCLILIWVIIRTSLKQESPVQQISHPPQGVAIIITGAAARIPQEAALLEELYNRGLLKNVVFISGVSSGALNAVMLNGILSGRITWKEYKDILCNIKNEDIFIQEGKKLPVNTEPARNLYKKIFEERLGYYQIGDLPYTTAISA